MLQKIKNNILALSATVFLALTFVPAVATAQTTPDVQNNLCGGATSLQVDSNQTCNNTSGSVSSFNHILTEVINIFSVVVGVVAVIMIIVAGFRYITSGGKQESVTGAKNTILYAVIGLVIVALAQIIVRFVLNKATSTS
jgi:hypothetical protein